MERVNGFGVGVGVVWGPNSLAMEKGEEMIRGCVLDEEGWN